MEMGLNLLPASAFSQPILSPRPATQQTTSDDKSALSVAVVALPTTPTTFIEAPRQIFQCGWNCFDLAVGLDTALKIDEKDAKTRAHATRDKLVAFALDEKNISEFRRLLAPEIRHAAGLTAVYLNLQKDKENSAKERNTRLAELFGVAETLAKARINEASTQAEISQQIVKLLAEDDRSKQDVDVIGLDRHTLPASLQTEALRTLVNDYQGADEAMQKELRSLCAQYPEMQAAVDACKQALSKTQGNRVINIVAAEDLYVFLKMPEQQKRYPLAWEMYSKQYHEKFVPHEKALQTYCEDEKTYSTYVKDYYGKQQGWVAFQRSFKGEGANTSMVDIAARLLNVQIVVCQKDPKTSNVWEEIYCTASAVTQYGKKMYVQFNGRDHFIALQPILSSNAPSPQNQSDDKSAPSIAVASPPVISIDFKALETQATLIAEEALQQKVKVFIVAAEKKIKRIQKALLITNSQNVVYTAVEELEKVIRDMRTVKINDPIDSAAVHTIITVIESPCKLLCTQIGNQWLAKDDTSAEELSWKIFALPCQQQLLVSDATRKKDFDGCLQQLKELIQERKGTAATNLFISYAWPTPQYDSKEYWLQPFLKQLREHLRQAGIHAILDIVDNKPGGNIIQFMEQAKDANFVLVICTESLKDKHLKGHGLKAVNTELNNIGHKRKIDYERGLMRVLPFLVTGMHATSYPANYELYSTVRDWRGANYLEIIKTIITQLHAIDLEDEKFNSIWNAFTQKYSTFTLSVPQAQVEEFRTQQDYKKKLDKLTAEEGYKTLLREVGQYSHLPANLPQVLPDAKHNVKAEQRQPASAGTKETDPEKEKVVGFSIANSDNKKDEKSKVEVKDASPKITTSDLSIAQTATSPVAAPQPTTFALGNSDYKSVIMQGGLLVDKTLFIKEVIDDKTQVKLIIRPRRFGKTSNMEMLKYFFEKTEIENEHAGLFYGRPIWMAGKYYQCQQGQYPVLFITLKDVKAKKFEEAYEDIKLLLSKLYKQYKKLLFKGALKDDVDEQKNYQRIIDGGDASPAFASLIKTAFKTLTEYLHKAYDKQVIVLIDEYDTPIHASYTNNYYPQMADFMRGILSPLLKDNSHLHQAVLTGILRLAKESIFSGLNNVRVYSALSNTYASQFGFQFSEVKELLKTTKIPEDLLGTIENWYGGYQIGSQKIFNPWSIVNFIEDNRHSMPQEIRYGSHWLHSSENKLIEGLLAKSDNPTKKLFKDLLENKSIMQEISEHTVFADISTKPQALWSFLFLSGYLTTKPVNKKAEEETVLSEIIIANKELYDFYVKETKTLFKNENVNFIFKNLNKLLIPVKNFEFSDVSYPNFHRVIITELFQKSYTDATRATIKHLLNETRQLIADSFINIALVKGEDHAQKEKSYISEQLREQRLSSYEDIHRPKELINLSALLDQGRPDAKQTGAKLLIEGRAGIGKTTLCQYLAHQWALAYGSSGHEFYSWSQQFAAVIWLPLRNLIEAKEDITLASFIYWHCLTLDQQKRVYLPWLERQLIALEKSHPLSILYLLDGYDEVDNNLPEKSQRRGLLNDLLQKPYCLLTSRPHRFSTKVWKSPYQHLETIGFLNENIPIYIQRFFRDFGGEKKADMVITALNANPNIKSVAHVPILLELICTVWKAKSLKEEKQTAVATTITMTSLYQQVILYLLRRYLVGYYLPNHQGDLKRAETYVNALSDQEIITGSPCKEQLAFLEDAGWLTMVNNKLEITAENSKNLIEEHGFLRETSDAKKERQQIRVLEGIFKELGLLKPIGESKTDLLEQNYCFIHLTFQEFFAARSLVNRLQRVSDEKSAQQNENIEDNTWMFIKTHCMEQRYEMVFWFAAGLLQDRPALLEKYFSVLINQPKDIFPTPLPYTEWRRLLLSLRCLEESGLPAIRQKTSLLESYRHFVRPVLLASPANFTGNSRSLPDDKEGSDTPRSLDIDVRYQTTLQYLRLSPNVRKAVAIDNLLNEQMEQKGRQEKGDKNLIAQRAATLAQIQLQSDDTQSLLSLKKLLQDENTHPELRTTVVNALGNMRKSFPELTVLLQKYMRSLDPYLYLKLAIIDMAEKLIFQDKMLLDLLIDGAHSHLLDVRHRSIFALSKLVNTKIETSFKQKIMQTTQVLLNAWHTKFIASTETSKALKQLHLFIPLIQALGFTAEVAHVLHAKLNDSSSYRTDISELLNRLEQINLVESNPLFNKPPQSFRLFINEAERLKQDALKAQPDIKAINNEIDALVEKLAAQKSTDQTLLPALIEKLQSNDTTIRGVTLVALKKLKELSPAVINVLFGMLQDEDDDIRCATIYIFEGLEKLDKKVVTALLRMLQDHEKKVRYAVVVALSRLKEPTDEVITVLLSMLQDKEPTVRCKIIEVLGRVIHRDESVIMALLGMLRDRESAVRSVTLTILGELKEPSITVIDALRPLLQDNVPSVQDKVIAILATWREPSNQKISVLLGVLQQKDSDMRRETLAALARLTNLSEAMVEISIEPLQRKELDIQLSAISTLASIKNTNEIVEKILVALLQHETSAVQHAAISALNSIMNPSEMLVKTLVGMLADKKLDVRIAAASALGKITNPSEAVVKALVGMLADKESDVCIAAESALGNITNPSEAVVKTLVGMLADKEWYVRRAAASALGNITNPSEAVVKTLVRMSADKESDVRRAAASALGKITNPSEAVVKTLVGMSADKESDVRRAVASALGNITNPSEAVVKTLVGMLADEEWGVRPAAASALGKITNPSEAVVKTLVGMSADKESDVRRAAASALGKITNPSEAVVKTLVGMSADKESDVRHAAVSALGKITNPSEAVVKTLVGMSADKASDVRHAAASALGNITNPSEAVVKTLVGMSADKEWGVRHAAVSALGKITNPSEAVVRTLAGMPMDTHGFNPTFWRSPAHRPSTTATSAVAGVQINTPPEKSESQHQSSVSPI